MILFLLVFLGGVLTILSPCVLPVLPFVFARAEEPFLRSGLPMLCGMAVTFAGIASLAAVGGGWAVDINEYGRVVALCVMAAFAMTLLSRTLAELLARPFVAIGNRLLQTTQHSEHSSTTFKSFLLGIATGLLWAPCAGPILGLILTGAAISGPNSHTSLLLLAYAAGAATSLAAALLIGGRLFVAMKQSLGAGEWIRRGLGAAILLAVVAIGAGWDTDVLTRLSLNSTNRLEQALISWMQPTPVSTDTQAGGDSMDGSNAMMSAAVAQQQANSTELPSLSGATAWINSPPLTPAALRGKVVLVDFWTYSCINCLRALPYVKAWSDKYKDVGLVVLGVHAPEFAFEKKLKNVQAAVKEMQITYPVALDNNYSIWQGFNNRYWPAHYFIDAQGKIRDHHFGEGDYDQSEAIIRQLLTEAGARNLPPVGTAVHADGVQAASDVNQVQSPETYLGYERADNFAASPEQQPDKVADYRPAATLALNQWSLQGKWRIDKEKVISSGAHGKIAFRFSARDLHLVIGPGTDGKPVRFRVTLDGQAPGASHGVDIDAQGMGIAHEQRLYQLIRQSAQVGEHVFTVEFLDDGAQAFAFTFG